jgi:redox-sensitive bicupin YhaK (pirin superfamily)
MTAATFAPHLHAGISAVTAIFEDSQGAFLNRDTLGHNIALQAGDLYWLAAASGAAHEEKPEAGARTHALQIFVNLPARLKQAPARSLHVQAKDIPILAGPGRRVRVVLGRSGEIVGASGTPEEMTMLDGFLEQDGRFSHPLPADWQAWIHAVAGQLTVRVEAEQRVLHAGSSIAVDTGSEADVVLESSERCHFVLMAARPIREPFVKGGPLVMSTADDVRRTLANYADGRFGRIPK